MTNSTKKQYLNYLGQTSSVESIAGTVNYSYNILGKLKQVWLNANSESGSVAASETNTEILTYYDVWGNKAISSDKASGTVKSLYNSLGQLLKGEDEKSLQTYAYNSNFTLDEKIVANKLSSTDVDITEYIYDNSNALLLKEIKLNNSFKKTLWHDELERVIKIEEWNGTETFTYSCSYDKFSRIISETLPEDVHIEYTYFDKTASVKTTKLKTDNFTSILSNVEDVDQFNRAVSVSSNNNMFSTLYWFQPSGSVNLIKTTNLQNNVVLQNNEYTFNPNGKMEYKKSTINGIYNDILYTFDTSDRLSSWTVNGTNTYNLTYDNFGNKKINTTLTQSNTDGMNYKSINNFYLDNHKTQLDVFPDTTKYSYTKNNRIEGITEPPTPNTQKGLSFTYGTDNQRRTMTLNFGGSTINKSYFMNYEKKEEYGELDKHVFYLDGSVLIKQGNSYNLYYTLNDYDGSIQALVNESGSVIERYAYDPWGKRLNPDNWSLADNRTSFIQDRGFTGHEHIDMFGVINMNARLYDPFVGAFLQPDPYMQDITNPVNFNRFTYCLNNPTKYTDPTGEKWEWKYLNPMFWFSTGMEYINIKTKRIRTEMVGAGVPDFTIGGLGVNSSGQTYYTIGKSGPIYSSNFNYVQHVENKINDVRLIYGNLNNSMPSNTARYDVGATGYTSSVNGPMFSENIGGAAANGGGAYSIDNAVNWLNANAYAPDGPYKYGKGECATYIRWSLEAGFGLNKDALKGKTVDQTGKAKGAAKTMGPYLENMGFGAVNTDSFLKGDIAVVQGYAGGTSNAFGETYGHVQVYNGNIWISDFQQLRDFWPGAGYRKNQPSFVIYRWGD